MTKLSVNINKIATLRNARGGDNPNLLIAASAIERFGADGITVHPRPDERHIRLTDVLQLSTSIGGEFNIEGFPDERYMDIIERVRPTQATLVPDSPEQLTSNHGWDTREHASMLRPIVERLRALGVRVSLFVDPSEQMVRGAAALGADRVELYTEPYAANYETDPQQALRPYVAAAQLARSLRLGLNAGHDLNLRNLPLLLQHIPWTDEVSIGHALICDALWQGLEQTVSAYKTVVSTHSCLSSLSPLTH